MGAGLTHRVKGWTELRGAVVDRLRSMSAVTGAVVKLRRSLDHWIAVPPPPPIPESRLRSFVDRPRPGDVVSGLVSVEGWAAWDGRAAAAIEVSVEGELLARGLTGVVDRPDVADALGEQELAASGWEMELDLRPFAGRTVTLQITVWPGGDEGAVLLASIPVEVPVRPLSAADATWDPRLVRIEEPFAGATVGPGFMCIRGWIADDGFPVASLDVIVNGRHAGRARLGLERPALFLPPCAPTDSAPRWQLSGFEHIVDLDVLPPTESVIRVQLVARYVGGSPTVVGDRMVRRVPAELAEVTPVGRGASTRRQVTEDDGPLDLVVFTHDLGYGGGQLWLSELLHRSGAGRRFRCTVVAPREGPLRAVLERDGMIVRITQPFPLDSLDTYEGRMDEMCHMVASDGHNAVLINTLLAFPGADVARRLALPAVWAIHESMPVSTYWAHALGSAVPQGIHTRFVETLRDTSAVVFEAEATRLLYQDAAGPGRSVVVPYGIDTAALDAFSDSVDKFEARRMLGIDTTRRIALVLGTIEPRKAQTRIAVAFAEVADAFPDWDLVFVGDTGSAYAEALREFVAASGCTDRIRVEPVVADTAPWYRSADVLVSASDIESMPRSALEAMCLEVPVLATAIFGLPELISDGVNGLLFEPGDLETLMAGLRRAFATDPAALDAMGAAASALIHANFDSGGYARTIIGLVERLRRDPGVRPADVLAEPLAASAAP